LNKVWQLAGYITQPIPCKERTTCVLATRAKKWPGLLGVQHKQI
jgi:hypothetical protein